MRQLFSRFWHDERGSVLVTEWVLVTTILVIALLPGLAVIRQRTLYEPTPQARMVRLEMTKSRR
jgi:hypothetical protein